MGILWAFVALFSWGIGDFLIQRSARKLGDGIALFCITACCTIMLLPFVWRDLTQLGQFDYRFWLLLGTSLIMLAASLFNLEALRVGKISVVEPIYALEVPVTALLASFVLDERLSRLQSLLVLALIIGIFLIATRSLRHLYKAKLEKGILFAFLATLGMGATNFLFGVGARETSPLVINWFASAFITLAMAGFLTYTHQWTAFWKDWKKQKKLIISVSLIDNLAWVAYALSTTTIPIAIATGISESYIALAALLGIYFNKERLKHHQYVGLACCVIAAVALALITRE